jgi:hypothetical protein
MPGSHPSSRSMLPLRWQKPALFIIGAGIGAFVIWTLPNWGEFWSNVAQFPTLWQVPANRRIIIYLSIKVASPLLIMGILAITMWLYFLIESLQEEEARYILEDKNVQHYTPAMKGRDHHAPSLRVQAPKEREVSFSAPARRQPVSGSSRYNPETPLPPTLPLVSTLPGQSEGIHLPVLPAQDEPSVLLAGQSAESQPSVSNGPTLEPAPERVERSPSAAVGKEDAASGPLISLYLLKEVRMLVNVPGSGQVLVPLTPNAKRVQLLAYIAWRRGELIDRDKILEHVFGWGLPDEEATEEKLSERFESHKKLLRKKIREVVIEQINTPAGRQVIDPDVLDPFVSHSGFWGLSGICRVEDLEAVEANHRIIALARKDGKLVDEIPEYVMEACEQLIANYPGDFLESLITKFPGEFRSWQGHSSWARKPYTHYRDCYLDALWYAAEYEWRMGQRSGNGELGEVDQRKQQEYFGRAAQRYETYATYACYSRFDYKASFGAHGEYGERVGMSERALRRCVVLLGAMGKTDRINQVWSDYLSKMRSASDGRWQPSRETLADMQAAQARTSAYRFAEQISQLPGAFAERPDPVS